MKTKAREILKGTFGYDEFRPYQEEIILSVLQRRDSLAIMPTGAGKSICYQIPAMIFGGITIVVSPLISLMKDQIDQLKELGIPAVMLNSSLDLEEYHDNIEQLRTGKIRLLYMAPETLMKQSILGILSDIKVDCIAIDESHCISEWGHDFRPEYRGLAILKDKFPEAAWLALTATATERVRKDIVKNLKFRDPAEFVAPFNRENLFLQVKRKSNSFLQLMDFLKHHNDESGIIYCLARNTTESLAERLSDYGYSVKPYHAGLADEERRKNHELFQKDEVRIITATIAFGMGVHKPDIRFIVHYDLPKSIESYYQEIGRAGRDGLPASCLLLFSMSDTMKIRYFIEQKTDETEKKAAEQHLRAILDYANTNTCRRDPLLSYFGEKYTEGKCAACDNCTGVSPAPVDITIEAQKFFSCIKRVNESFGMNHIIDILRGSESQRILEFNHQKLSTYGIGMDHSKKDWQDIVHQFISQGLIFQDPDKFNVLKLTPSAYEVMKGALKVSGRMAEETDAAEVQKAMDYDGVLFAILRKKRKELADAENVPPYVIFSDKTLMEMSAYYPQHRSSLMDIHGVGVTKYEKFGEIFIGIIREYCSEHNLEEKIKAKSARANPAKVYKYKIIGDEYNNGRSVKDIAAEHGIKPQTVFNHLYDYMMNGFKLTGSGYSEFLILSEDTRHRLYSIFESRGVEALKPVYEAMNGSIDYDMIAVYRVDYMCNRMDTIKGL